MKKLSVIGAVLAFVLGFGSVLAFAGGYEPPVECIIGDYYPVRTNGCCMEADADKAHVEFCNGVTTTGEPCGDCEWRCVFSQFCPPGSGGNDNPQ